MRTHQATAALLILAMNGCAAHAVGENLGGPFVLVRKEATPASKFESVQHIDHLFFKNGDLGAVGFVSVAPSGGYAIFERDGELMLIVSATGRLTTVTDGQFSIPRYIRWNEQELLAEVEYYDDRPKSRVVLK